MKFSFSLHATILAIVAVMPLASQAATTPLNYPYGLVVDSSGSLYVANNDGNEVLKYNSSHAQIAVITSGVSGPTGLALGPAGNLWVANSTGNSVTEYSPAGKLVKTVTKIYGTSITNPEGVAVDAMGNLWINVGFQYAIFLPFNLTKPWYFSFGANINGIAVYKDLYTIGGNSNSFTGNLFYLVSENPSPANPPTCFAPAYDASGNLYCGNEDYTLTVQELATATTVSTLVDLGYFPTGVAVDSSRGWIYVADGVDNQINVYSTAGKLLTTIK